MAGDSEAFLESPSSYISGWGHRVHHDPGPQRPQWGQVFSQMALTVAIRTDSLWNTWCCDHTEYLEGHFLF